ncbi:hypothetical protein AC1031_009282 [Aphanomyces cochlioides]|nr:hypothetical protein AC1031_009282 [Aphanomyces cochlioides]
MTPYTIFYGMPDDETKYNLVHSRSRMVVECAFGLWKNKFRIFKIELLHHHPSDMARLIEVSLVLHNWFIDYNEETLEIEPNEFPEWMHIGGDTVLDEDLNQVEGPCAQRTRDSIKQFIFNNVEL